MPKKIIYLAGAINGCKDKECKDWRNAAKAQLEPQFETLDPMRRDYRGREDENVKELVNGDLNDLVVCDMVLASCPKASWGTGMEIFYAAHELGKPVVIMVPENGPVSPWLRYHSLLETYGLDEAISFIKAYYTPKALYANTYFGREQMKAC
jgi:nucleoside 2-deoxyribosyltransferase